MKTKMIFLMAAIILIAGCSKKQKTTEASNPVATEVSNLKPVTGAFGYNLGDKVSGEIDDYIIVKDTPPFQELSIERTSDDRICRISGSGIVNEDEDALHDNQKRLVAVLTEKYGARDRIGEEKWATQVNDVDLYFGTENRAAHLGIKYSETNQFITVDYYDKELEGIYNTEQESKNKTDDENKKAALSKGL